MKNDEIKYLSKNYSRFCIHDKNPVLATVQIFLSQLFVDNIGPKKAVEQEYKVHFTSDI